MTQISQFIINHWGLWLALLTVLILFFLNEFLTQKKRAKTLSPLDAVERMNHDDALIIDLRDMESYKKGHIIHSIQANSDDFSQDRMNKYKTKPIILVCARGLQSEQLASKLKTHGFLQPMALAGGMNAWQTAGLPIVKSG